MRIVPRDFADPSAIRACHELLTEADRFDDPDGPPWSLRQLKGWFQHPADPMRAWTVSDEETGALLGWCHLTLPSRENTSRAYLHLTVHPAHRRRGLGTALLRHAAGAAAEAGRVTLGAEVLQDTAGSAFAVAAGASPGLVDARRVQVISAIPAGRVAALRQQAAGAAGGYSLLHWAGRIPEEYWARYAAVENAMADAPHGAGVEPWVWDADRVGETMDRNERAGRKVYTVAARHDASGELAGVTQVQISLDTPGWGYQLVTAVTRPHRGHRLGLLLKTAMLEWLAGAEPGVDRILTGNAASNEHMIAINEQLGYRLLPPLAQMYDLPVAAVLS
jgi:RimJ/RimL family protein N-acetyltransferase